ncbi:MAG: glycosyltransferase [Pricia sp.]
MTSYPPRECGIATYSQDLISALEQKFGNSVDIEIVPLETKSKKYDYPKNIGNALDTSSELQYSMLSNRIATDNDIDLVVVQHEFGFFSNNEGAFIGLLENLDCPVVMVLHTVLPQPDPDMRSKVRGMLERCQGAIVMTQASADILYYDYGLKETDVRVIPHGTHLISHREKASLKEKYGLDGKMVLSTFGLMGPDKSIETTLHALPGIVARYPNIMFLILGKTHPELVEKQGEAYRSALENIVDELELGNNVRFVDRFLPLEELLEYLQLTDIYLFTSKNPDQAVSGTFSYALGCGCPVVSTPIPHAEEVLGDGAGKFFDFGDSAQLEKLVLELLGNRSARKKMAKKGLQKTATSAWENSALAHAKFFVKHAKLPIVLKHRRPPIKMSHLRGMTTDAGIVQFSRYNRPDIESGYTVDDNARALIAVCQHYSLTGDTTDLKLIRIYFGFVQKCIRNNGLFFNYVGSDLRFTEENYKENLEDSFGRAVWAIGYLVSTSSCLPASCERIAEGAHELFGELLVRICEIQSPRAVAFAIKGLYYYTTGQGAEQVNAHLRTMADRLVQAYRSEKTDDWYWYEKYLTYANAAIPEALLMAYVLTLDGKYRTVAQETFRFLISKTFPDGAIRVISNRERLNIGDRSGGKFRGGEQPIDVAYTILALKRFDKIFPGKGYEDKMERAFDWFMGDNPNEEIIYNNCTGGCYDGLEFDNVNLDQGAESTVCYLLARMALIEDGMDQD